MFRQPDPLTLAGQIGTQPPLERWHPEFMGEMPIVIDRQGQWHYQGQPMTRHRLVSLLSRVLRREDDGYYYLVTPQDKWRIQVERNPFMVVHMDRLYQQNQWVLRFTTRWGEWVEANANHPLQISDWQGQPHPEILFRHGCYATLSRGVYHELSHYVEAIEQETVTCYQVESHGRWFILDQEPR